MSDEEEEEEAWMDAYPTEYRTQPGLPQTVETFAQQQALDARDRVRKYPIEKSNNALKCNAFNPKTKSHCDAHAGKAVGDAKLYRCVKHGGGNVKGSRGECTFPGCEGATGRPMGNIKGYPFCGTKGTGCIKRALAYEAVHGKKPEGMKWSDFVRPPPTSAPSAAAKQT